MKYIYYPTTGSVFHVPSAYFSNRKAAQKYCDEINEKMKEQKFYVQKDYILKKW